MRKIIILLLMIVIVSSCSQEETIAELGKKTPDYTFKNVLNNAGENISIESLKGKVVILEFWATWCGPCIPAMKKLDSLQSDFEEDVEVIAISNETKAKLKRYIETSKTSLKIASDTTHEGIFKYKVIPHSIIIDKNGIIRAITNPKNINRQVLKSLINNQEIDLALKDDFYIDPQIETKVIAAESDSNYRIELKSYDQESRGGYRYLKTPEGIINGIEMNNSTIPRLYQSVFQISSPNRILFKDSLSYADFSYKEKSNLYSLLVEASDETSVNWKEIAVNFLNKNFDTNAKLAIDSLDCFVLRNVDHILKESTSNTSSYMFRGPNLDGKKIKMARLEKYLENFTSMPVVDQTNLKGEYDISLKWQFEDPKTLHAELKKLGLKLEKSKTKLPVEVMKVYKRK